jgi:hypothetical protein
VVFLLVLARAEFLLSLAEATAVGRSGRGRRDVRLGTGLFFTFFIRVVV